MPRPMRSLHVRLPASLIGRLKGLRRAENLAHPDNPSMLSDAVRVALSEGLAVLEARSVLDSAKAACEASLGRMIEEAAPSPELPGEPPAEGGVAP